MRKLFTSLLLSSLVILAFGQPTVTELWNFSVQKANLGTAVDDVKNGIAVSPDGTKLYLSTRANGSNQVAIYNPADGTRTGYLPGLSGFASTYGGDVAVDGNGAIYASNVIISASALMVAKWDNATATPTAFISTTAHTGSGTNRIGYGMDVRVNSAGNGFIVMHKNGTANFLIWTITNNVPTSQDATIITAGTAMIDEYARISIIDDNNFWVDGNKTRPWLATITKSGPAINATPTAISNTPLGYRTDVYVGVGGMTEFSLDGKRYGVIAANQHYATSPWDVLPGHMALLQELKPTGVAVEGAVIATLPTAGMGKTSDASHFVESVVHVDGYDAYIYSMGGFNGITAHKVSVPAPPAGSKTFTVTVPNGTANVYIAGTFTDKDWDITAPYELTATSNPNEFTGTFDCEEGIEYKYFCEKGHMDYQEAIYDGVDDPVLLSANRTYNAADEVAIWYRVNKINLNASFTAAIPTQLYVRVNSAVDGELMTKSGSSFSFVLGGIPGDKYPANTKYKYYTNDKKLKNWETDVDGNAISDRWTIAPVMNDVIERFESPIVEMSGVYKVGTTGGADFSSLNAAAAAINEAVITGDVVFEITSDLLETASVRIGANTGIHSVTIRPDADVDRKIELDMAADNNRASGVIIVGMTADSWDNMTATQNVIIDGYAVGGTTRRLTLATTDAANIYHGPIQIVGNTKFITVKNCILTQLCAVAGSTTYAVRIRVEKNTAGTAFVPSDITIENNVITAVKNNTQMAIGLTGAAGLTQTLKQVVIKNNEIYARTRGISMSNNEDIVISGNTFSTEQISSGMLSCWIQGVGNGAGNVTVSGNKFISALSANVSAGAYGIRGIIASGGGTWYIDNNFFTGFKTTGAPAAAGAVEMITIRCGNTCFIRHNTFVLNALNANSNLTPTYQGILIAAGTPEIKNNILISNEDAVTNTLIVGTNGGDSDYNIMYLKAGNTKARINSTHATFAAYQAANPTKDVNSKSVDVDFVDAATGDLRITGTSLDNPNIAVPLLAAVGVDMFGTTRHDPTYVGAHEATHLYTNISNTNNETARIMRTVNGVQVELNGEAIIELYNMNGVLLDKTRMNGSYSRDLDNGIYIIRINGKATKFIK